MTHEQRQVVIPSQVLGDTTTSKAGRGTFVERGKIYAERLGILYVRGNMISVIALRGRYDPVVNDIVIGIVEEAATSNWMVDIRAPYPALLHVNEVPWEIEFGDTEHYLNTGDVILAKVLSIDESKKLQITLNDRNLFKIKGGHIIEVESSIVPRIIGKSGSMIDLIKKYTRCRIFVGQNGRLWVDGDAEGVKKVFQAVNKIQNEAITFGLTARMEELLKKDVKDVR